MSILKSLIVQVILRNDSADPTSVAHSAVQKGLVNRYIFRFTLNAAVVIPVNIRCCSSVFHRPGAVTLRALSPQ